MTIYHRLKRWRGYKTIESFRETFELYKYTITHLNGDTSTVHAHYKLRKSGGFVEFYRYQKEVKMRDRVLGDGEYVMTLGWDPVFVSEKIRELGGIKEIEKDHVGNTTFIVDIDMADKKLIGIRKEHDITQL